MLVSYVWLTMLSPAKDVGLGLFPLSIRKGVSRAFHLLWTLNFKGVAEACCSQGESLDLLPGMSLKGLP